ncbi:hypothetical protein BDY17DRAFT_73558 [Neohortaea acidophila]|uniref:Uncharacterized protein n=1 Tax=Neohortaea acidophila TaxID=245834 RepID=A0A6A6Q4B4_9PEZI|nr:uncharacterized protein BDY17DRAFT_73558 [Neohortaea acidophila]KAF2486237.1 hypothetical protein BDY17DRAFT_73558 [Neohortaea acidophila]
MSMTIFSARKRLSSLTTNKTRPQKHHPHPLCLSASSAPISSLSTFALASATATPTRLTILSRLSLKQTGRSRRTKNCSGANNVPSGVRICVSMERSWGSMSSLRACLRVLRGWGVGWVMCGSPSMPPVSLVLGVEKTELGPADVVVVEEEKVEVEMCFSVLLVLFVLDLEWVLPIVAG